MQEHHSQSALQPDKANEQNRFQDSKQNIEELLLQGNAVQFKPQGFSMYPLFVPGRDEAVVAPTNPTQLKRGDVVLYRRDGSILVLHRIWKRKGDEFYLVGDNQSEIEGPLRSVQMKGVLVEIIRKGKCFSVRHPIYRFLAALWLWLRPFRPVLSQAAARCKQVLKKR